MFEESNEDSVVDQQDEESKPSLTKQEPAFPRTIDEDMGLLGSYYNKENYKFFCNGLGASAKTMAWKTKKKHTQK